VVDVCVECVVDASRKGADHGVLDRREAVLEEERAERRFEQRGEHILVLRKPFELLGLEAVVVLDESRAELELTGDDGAARTRDDVRADLREPSLREVGVARVELVCDGQLEDAVAEKLQPLVRLDPLGRPRGVRERGRRPLGRQRVDQRRELSTVRLAATGATRRSRQPGRQS
jgi:hypothetical protein